MTWVYCEQWNNLLEEPMEPMTPTQAAERHATGKLYTAVLQDGGSPELRVEVRFETGYVSVVFMDRYGRDELDYSFTQADDRLFLQTVTSYSYGDSIERGGYATADAVESFDFQRDGVVHRTIDEAGRKERESRAGVDVSDQYEPIPEFGSYDSLIRRERS